MLRYLCLVTFFLLVSCQKQDDRNLGNRVRFNLVSDPHSLDPRVAKDTCAQAVVRMCFEGLTRIGPDDQPQLALAHSVETSDDGLEYRFYLRDAFWSNGERVKASDFVYSWQKSLSPAFPAEMAAQLYAIENAEEIKEGLLMPDQLGAVAESDSVLLVRLAHPTPYFLEQLATPVAYPICESVDQFNPYWHREPLSYVSNGPFLLKSWKHRELLRVEKNPYYWDTDTVKLEGVELVVVDEDTELKMFEKGRLDWAGSPISTLSLEALPLLKQQGNFTSKEIAGTRFMRVNTRQPILKQVAFRRALSSALDREALVIHVAQGGQRPATGLVPPALLGNTIDASEVGEFAAPKDGLTLIYARNEKNHLLCQAMQEQWRKELGLKVRLEGLELKVFFDRVARGQYDLALGSWLADIADPANFLEVFAHRSSPSNQTGWESESFAKLLEISRRETDHATRRTLLREAEKALIHDVPVIPIFHCTMLYLKQPHLEGVYLSPLGQVDFKWAHLNNPET